MAQRQHLHGDADLDAAGARGDGAGDAERRRQHRALRVEMKLGQPHHVEAQLFGRVDLLERLGKGVGVGAPRQRRELVKHAEFHGDELLCAVRRAGGALKSEDHRGRGRRAAQEASKRRTSTAQRERRSRTRSKVRRAGCVISGGLQQIAGRN
jgi:hypothetical protein